MKYNCIIVDDDEIDRLTTLSFARRYPFLNITGIYASSAAAMDRSGEEDAAVLLLDIDMQGFRSFVLLHRSFAVHKHAIGGLTSQEVMVGGVALPVGRSYRVQIEEMIRK